MAVLSGTQRFLYGLGFLPLFLCVSVVQLHVQVLYRDVFKLPADKVGTAWTIFSIVTAGVQPFVGVYSDRYVNAKAKTSTANLASLRRPWLWAALVPWSASFIALWIPHSLVPGMDDAQLFAFFVCVLVVQGVSFATLFINYMGSYPAYFPTAEERVPAAGLKQVFSILGMLSGAALPPVIAGSGWADPSKVAYMGAVALVLVLLALLGTGSVPDREPTTKSETATDEPASAAPSMLTSMLSAFNSVSFSALFAAMLCVQFANNTLSAGFPLYVKYVAGVSGPYSLFSVTLSEAVQVSILLTSFYVFGLAASPLWLSVTKRYGPLSALRIECVIYGVLCMYFSINGVEGMSGFSYCMIGVGLLGLAMSGFMVLPDMLVSDCIDEDAAKTGKRREGVFFGMFGVLQRLASAIQGYTSGYVLAEVGYVPGGDSQTELAKGAITTMTSLAPAAFLMLAAFVFGFYERKDELAAKATKKKE